jgi:precorrin-6B methylase 2
MGARAVDRPEGALALVPGLRTRVDAAGHVLVETPLGGIVDAGPMGHAILALFARPNTMSTATDQLKNGRASLVDLMPATATIVKLIEAGAIGPEGGLERRFGWSDAAEHARMIDDSRRTGAYLAAIRSAVRPDDVVVDIGTGSGILAVAAARAGARHVYAIEASDIADVAEQVFERNGVSDRVTLLRGWSSRFELPEPATLLVTETMGVEPFDEDIVGTVLDARRRLLEPTARVVPRSLRLDVEPLFVPRQQRWSGRVDADAVERWQRRYGIDLSPLRGARRRSPLHWPVDSQVAATWTSLAPPTKLLAVDLAACDSASVTADVELGLEHTGRVDAILVTFRAELHDGISLVHRPRAGEYSSWDASVWFLPDGLDVRAGDRLGVSYRYGVPGAADGLDCALAP